MEVLGSMCGSDSPLSSRCLSPGLPVPANTPGHKSHWQQVIAGEGLHTQARSATSQKHTGVTSVNIGPGARLLQLRCTQGLGHNSLWEGCLKKIAPSSNGGRIESGLRQRQVTTLGDIRQTSAPYSLMQGCRHHTDGGRDMP